MWVFWGGGWLVPLQFTLFDVPVVLSIIIMVEQRLYLKTNTIYFTPQLYRLQHKHTSYLLNSLAQFSMHFKSFAKHTDLHNF